MAREETRPVDLSPPPDVKTRHRKSRAGDDSLLVYVAHAELIDLGDFATWKKFTWNLRWRVAASACAEAPTVTR